MTKVITCPVHEGLAEELPSTIDGKSIHCEVCGDFDVSGTVYDPGFLERLDPEERRRALAAAKKAAPQGKRPMITSACLGKIVIAGSSLQGVNRKADDWCAQHPDIKITRRSRPWGTGFAGPSLNDMKQWTVTIEYEPTAKS